MTGHEVLIPKHNAEYSKDPLMDQIGFEVMTKVEIWRERFEAALEKIERYRDDEHADMRLITRWLMETKANPYGYLHRSDARSLDSAVDFAGLLHTIHHALVDDGEITFVAVSGRPMMVFAERDEIGHVELRLTAEREADERRGTQPTYEFIDGVAAFIDRRDRYEAHRAALIDLSERRNAKEMTTEEWRIERQRLEEVYVENISKPFGSP